MTNKKHPLTNNRHAQIGDKPLKAVIHVRAEPDFYAQLKAAAKRADMPLAKWIRRQLQASLIRSSNG